MDKLQLKKIINNFGDDYLGKKNFLINLEEITSFWIRLTLGLATRKNPKADSNITHYYELTKISFKYEADPEQFIYAEYFYESLERWGSYPSLVNHADSEFLFSSDASWEGGGDFFQLIVGDYSSFSIAFKRSLSEPEKLLVFLNSDDMKIPRSTNRQIGEIDLTLLENKVKVVPVGTWEPNQKKLEFIFHRKDLLKDLKMENPLSSKISPNRKSGSTELNSKKTTETNKT